MVSGSAGPKSPVRCMGGAVLRIRRHSDKAKLNLLKYIGSTIKDCGTEPVFSAVLLCQNENIG